MALGRNLAKVTAISTTKDAAVVLDHGAHALWLEEFECRALLLAEPVGKDDAAVGRIDAFDAAVVPTEKEVEPHRNARADGRACDGIGERNTFWIRQRLGRERSAAGNARGWGRDLFPRYEKPSVGIVGLQRWRKRVDEVPDREIRKSHEFVKDAHDVAQRIQIVEFLERVSVVRFFVPRCEAMLKKRPVVGIPKPDAAVVVKRRYERPFGIERLCFRATVLSAQRAVW